MRLHSLRLALLATLIATPFMPAQDGMMMTPPKELGRYEKLVGNWEGDGLVRASADEDPVKWTAHSTCKKVLGGWAYQEDMRIDLAMEGAPPLIFRSYYGYDQATKQYRVMSFSNAGSPSMQRILWAEDNLIVGSQSMMEEGQSVTETWRTRFATKDLYIFRIERAVAGASPFLHVNGGMRRGGKGFEVTPSTVKLAMAAPDPAMKRLRDDSGVWILRKGSVVPMPGMAAMPVSGKETISRILGGHIQMGHIVGDPAPGSPFVYEGYVYMGWSDQDNCYKSFTLSNSGEFMVEDARILDDGSVVFVSTGVLAGQPMANRTILRYQKNGSAMHIRTTRLVGTGKPEFSFEGFFEKSK